MGQTIVWFAAGEGLPWLIHFENARIRPARPINHYPKGVNDIRPGLARSAYPGNPPPPFFRINPEGVEENPPEARAAQNSPGQVADVFSADPSPALVGESRAIVPGFDPYRVERRIYNARNQGRRSRANPGLRASHAYSVRQTAQSTNSPHRISNPHSPYYCVAGGPDLNLSRTSGARRTAQRTIPPLPNSRPNEPYYCLTPPAFRRVPTPGEGTRPATSQHRPPPWIF